MKDSRLQSHIVRSVGAGEEMIVAVFAFRYDAHLVPGLLENIAPMVNAWVSFDDRDATVSLSSEVERRRVLLHAARDLGATWILVVDPDERYEDSLIRRIPELVAQPEKPIWMFSRKEMFTTDSFRTDGLWGHKAVQRLFPCLPDITLPDQAWHAHCFTYETPRPVRMSGVFLYHFRMATPERRALRRELYARADPERKMQSVGYDYLDDERFMTLHAIAPDRGYRPLFVDDGGLWSPPVDRSTPVLPDPPIARLHFAQRSLRNEDLSAAIVAVQDVVASDPENTDMLSLLAVLQARKGDSDVHRILGMLAGHSPPSAYALINYAGMLVRDADETAASIAARAAVNCCPNNPILTSMANAMEREATKFAKHDATWRRWVPSGGYEGDTECRIYEGQSVVQSDIAIIVIGYRAPPEIVDAVRSILDQDTPAEVVVVNSGGGDVRTLLGNLANQVRLIEVKRQLFIGAARNIGIDASRASIVAFLASDCRASPQWASGRLSRHLDGASMVSSAVVPDRPENVFSQVSSRLFHWRRLPHALQSDVVHFGRSYHRSIFLRFGYFSTGLRTMEDSEFHERLPRSLPPQWAPEIITKHLYPTSLGGLVSDRWARMRRNMATVSHGKRVLGIPDIETLRRRHKLQLAALLKDPHLTKLSRFLYHGLLRFCYCVDVVAFRYHQRESSKKGQDFNRVADLGVLLDQAEELARSNDAKQQAQAITLLQHAISIAPAEVRPLELLCDLHLQRGEAAQARAASESAVTNAPNVSKFWLKAAETAEAAKDVPSARFYGQGALSRAPADEGVHALLERLRQRPD